MNEPDHSMGLARINKTHVPTLAAAVTVATTITILAACWLAAGVVIGMLARFMPQSGLQEIGQRFLLPVMLGETALGACVALGICFLLAGAQLWAVLGRSAVVSFFIGWICLGVASLFMLLFLWAVTMIVTGMSGADHPDSLRNPWPWLVMILISFIGVTMLRWRDYVRVVHRKRTPIA